MGIESNPDVKPLTSYYSLINVLLDLRKWLNKNETFNELRVYSKISETTIFKVFFSTENPLFLIQHL